METTTHCETDPNHPVDSGHEAFTRSTDPKFTPGPWVASRHYGDTITVLEPNGFAVVEAPNTIILEDYPTILGTDHWAGDDRAHRDLPDEEQAANAHLIAAAPEMYEAIEYVLETYDNRGSVSPDQWIECMERAREILARARGEGA